VKYIRVYQTPRNTITAKINERRHDNVTPTSLERLAQIVMTEQMLGRCDVTPNMVGVVGWTANIHYGRRHGGS
jgi:hypothetical protein